MLEPLSTPLTEQKKYALIYLAQHLYNAQEWYSLFTLLDNGTYGRAKIEFDPSTALYAQDLNLGRQASTREGLTLSEGILLLPHLWRYTLLHCSLTSQANNYSLEKFEALMLLQREQEALGLAELLTYPYSQARAMLLIAYLLRMNSNKIQVSLQLLMRVQHIAVSIKDSKKKAEVLAILVHELAEMHLWQQAINIADTIGSSEFRIGAMIAIGNALGQAKCWKLAKDTLIKTEYIIYTVDDIDTKTEAMAELGKAWAHIHQWKQVKNIICTLNNSWLKTNVLVELGKALRHVGQNKQAENVWAEAERITQTIENPCDKAFMLGILSCELVETLYRERANSLWKEALHTAQNIEDIWEKSQILIELGDMFAQAQYLDRANIVLTEATKALGAIEESRVNDIERAGLQGELGKAWAHAHEWERTKFIANDIGYIPADRAMIDLSGTSKIRAQLLVELGNMMAQMGLQEHAKRLWVEVLPTRFLEWHEDRKWLLESLEMTFRQLHQSQLAEITAQMIDDTLSKEDILAQLGKEGAMFPEEGVSEPIETSSVNTDMLDKLCDIWIQTENLRRVENTISEYKKERRIENTISEEDESEERRYKIEILSKMAEALAKSGKNDYLLHLVQKIWLQAEEIYDADDLIPLATNLISLEPQVGISFCNAFILVDTFLKDGRI